MLLRADCEFVLVKGQIVPQLSANPAHWDAIAAAVVVLADNRAEYTPEPGFHGDDVFLYQADDGGPWPGNTAWVRIRVGDDG